MLIHGINTIKATAIGNKLNQQNLIKPAYVILGNVARIQTNKKANKHVLIPNIIDCKLIKVLFINNSGIL
jgi:hypothetical protein